ncbi:DUF2800 domain-containing protein [Xylella fastidiosa subsp. multiplex]|uniref:DUF2800 domain-containing protein n=1 Tax=Xylella fastidiosa TaxID=2371 RepID=UPI00234D7B46|nr:DUF2800 domain-containing protein [Xylella fastidiosa]MDC6416644.1 DUF2800 domain-containing protein [Xylella fastidiosa subsp. multiplex]
MSQHAMYPRQCASLVALSASVPLTRTCKDDASPFADEGTVAHTVAADALPPAASSAYVGNAMR